MTESYRQELGDDDFEIVRYDWLRSAALVAGESTTRSARPPRALRASKGIGPEEADPLSREAEPKVNEKARRAMARTRGMARDRGAFPAYNRDLMELYYQELDKPEEGTELESVRGSSRHIRDELNQYMSCTADFSGPTWHTSPWSQFLKPNGNAIGCGNTAWAILYSYWRQHRGKTRLFDGADVNHRSSTATEVENCMWSCYSHTESHDAPYNQSRTWPGKMSQGIRYASGYRYRGTCTRRTGLTEYAKFNEVIREIRAERPAILLINATGIGGPNHYVVIEGADKRQYRYTSWGSWHNRDVKYLCNFGHGRTQKWIYVRDYGANEDVVFSAFSVYLINIL